MIILDTNVLSALMRRDTEPAVVAWLDNQPPESLWTTAVTVFEIRFGIRILADGRRRRRLEDAFAEALETKLDRRILSVDRWTAEAAADMAAERRRAGRPIEVRDLLIAGITSARKATLATRNIRHFENLGIALADPWRD
ncbi:MAG TPA: type II toxin-antitoxin system VapC family toxin [Stellaceae bacterium]|nr:type II toxin-antitoxin system VapC family toxin [Stellaceae bacterium]